MDEITNLKSSRSKILRKIKTLKTQLERIVEGVVQPEERISSLVTKLDGYWEEFSDEHDALNDALARYESTQEGSIDQEGMVNSKSMSDYYEDA